MAGDAIYIGVHQYLGESADGGRDAWRTAIDTVHALAPRWVVASHKDKDLDRPGFVEASVAGSSLRPGLKAIFTRKDQISGRLVHHSDRRKLPGPAVLSGKPLVAVEALPAQTEASPSDLADRDAWIAQPSGRI